MLADLFFEVLDGLIQPRFRRLKSKALLSAASIALISLFAIMALFLAILIVFLGLANAYNPVTAALILFGFCIFMCLGTLLIYKLVSRYEDRRYEDEFFERGRLRRPTDLRLDERLDDLKHQFKDALSRHKFGGLAAVATAGLLIGSRPKLVLGLARFALGRKLRQKERERERFRWR